MKRITAFIFALAIVLGSSSLYAKMDVAELFADALLRSDTQELEKILAPNFWFVGSNGHISDKEHFIQEIGGGELKYDHFQISNLRESGVGDTRLITATVHQQASSSRQLPAGLMRISMVIAENQGSDEIALFQATPVIPSADCSDGNCRIR